MSTKMAVSQSTLVQKEHYLHQSKHIYLPRRHICPCGQSRHSWQGDTLICTCDQNNYVYRAGPPQIGSWRNSTLAIRGAKTFIEKTQKGGVHHFQAITEEDSSPLLRQLSSTHHGTVPCHANLPWHWLPEALPCCTEGFAYLASHQRSFLTRC